MGGRRWGEVDVTTSGPPVPRAATAPATKAAATAAHRSCPSAVLVAVTAALAALAFVTLRLLAHGGDATVFVNAGDRLTNPSQAPDLAVAEDSSGYDGQFSYRLARSPLSTDDRFHGIALDRPVDRTARIGYPALSWAASLGGQPTLLPWALIGVNVLAIGALAGFAALLARDMGRSTWLGLLPAACPGLTVALARDLTEPVAGAAVVGALVLLRRGRWGWGAAALTGAALTRETALITAVAVIAAAMLRLLAPVLSDRLGRRVAALTGAGEAPPLWVGVVPVVGYGAWQGFLRAVWDGPEPFRPEVPVNGLTVPLLRPLGQVVTFLGSLSEPVDLLQLVQLVLVLVAVVLAVLALGHTGAGRPHERIALVAATVFLLSLSTWDRAVVFLRYPTDAAVLAAAVVPAAVVWSRRLAMVTGPLLVTTMLVWISIT